MECLNCFSFKYKKGWDTIHCKDGHLIDEQGKERLFKALTKGNKRIEERARDLKVLNGKCSFFNG